MWRNLLPLAGCIPVAVLLVVVCFHRWQRKQAGERTPLTEKLLRPPGHSLSQRIEATGEEYNTWLFTGFLAAFFSVGAWKYTPSDWVGGTLLLALFGIGAGACTVIAWRKLSEIRSCRLGLLGEQAMAEQLRALVSKGYQVFHDVPGDGKWNVDHVAVGPAGVFAIETKYRTKKPGPAGGPDHEAVFDGKGIAFPGWNDVETIAQARRNAKWLGGMLSKATGEAVEAQPIVALPGWWVTLKAKADVIVLSGKQVAGFIGKEPTKLSPKVIQQIVYQLDQRCRTVEF